MPTFWFFTHDGGLIGYNFFFFFGCLGSFNFDNPWSLERKEKHNHSFFLFLLGRHSIWPRPGCGRLEHFTLGWLCITNWWDFRSTRQLLDVKEKRFRIEVEISDFRKKNKLFMIVLRTGWWFRRATRQEEDWRKF